MAEHLCVREGTSEVPVDDFRVEQHIDAETIEIVIQSIRS
jgi:hypothetical protein